MNELLGLISSASLLYISAPTQYDYYSPDYIGSGVDMGISMIIVIIILAIIAVVGIFVCTGVQSVYYWFNPKANPKYKLAKQQEELRKKEYEKQIRHEKWLEQKRKNAPPPIAVDLGLSVKWSSFNLGAYKPSDIGRKFQWCKRSSIPGTSTKLAPHQIGDISGDKNLDWATELLGNNWRTPTETEYIELIERCQWETTFIDGIKGKLVTGPNGNSIFVPFTESSTWEKVFISGKYWTSSPSISLGVVPLMDTYGPPIVFCCSEDVPKAVLQSHPESFLLYIRPVQSVKEQDSPQPINALNLCNVQMEPETLNQYEGISQADVSYHSCQRCSDGSIYNEDGKVLLNARKCFKNTFTIKEGTVIVHEDAFNRQTREIILPPSLGYIPAKSIPSNCKITSYSPFYIVAGNLLIDTRKKSIIKCLNIFVREVTINEPIAEIEENAFSSCEALRKVVFPRTLRRIGKSAFSGCKLLASINLPDSITSIGDNAFYLCENLKLQNFQLPKDLSIVGSGAFRFCKSLRIDAIPNKLISIGDYALQSCHVTKVYIPKSLSTIGKSPLPKDCDEIYSESDRFIVRECLLIDSYNAAIIQIVQSATSLTIPNDIKSIQDYAFSQSNIVSIVLPGSIEKLGIGLFWACKNLMSVTLNCSISSIPPLTFGRCISLKNILIPRTVKGIGKKAFFCCTELESVSLSDNTVVIETEAFCYSGITHILLPQEIRRIGTRAFYWCAKLQEVSVLGNIACIDNASNEPGTSTIESEAFCYCENLKSITIPHNIRELRTRSISKCKSLIELIILPTNVTLAKGWIDCLNLKTIHVTKEMREIIKHDFSFFPKIKIKTL